MTAEEAGLAGADEPAVAPGEHDRAGSSARPRPPLGPVTDGTPGSLASDPPGTAELTTTGARLPTTRTMELFQAFY